jgi:hypothetical protein
MAVGDAGQTRLTVRMDDEDLAHEVESLMREQGASEVSVDVQEGIIPVLLPVVVAAVMGAGGIVAILAHIRKITMCQQIIDARSGDIETKNNCDRRDGSIVVLAGEGASVEITNVGPLVDLTKVYEAAIKGVPDAIKAAAEAVGGSATVGANGGAGA